MNIEVRKMLDKVLNMAKEMGAAEAELLFFKNKSHSMKAQKGQIAENSVAAANILGIRLEKEQRIGISHSEALDEASLQYMIRVALENSKLSKINQDQRIVVRNTKELEPDCSKVCVNEDISLARKRDLALSLEALPLKRDKRIKVVPYSAFSEDYQEQYIANSLGNYCADRSHSYSCYTYVLLEDRARKADYGEQTMAFKFAELDYEACVDKACQEAAQLLAGRALESGAYDVIFSPDALAALFNVFALVFSASAAKKELNPWRSKLGADLSDKRLSITDIPTAKNSNIFQVFDAEGGPCKALPLISAGKFVNMYQNSETAAFFKSANNFRAGRSPRSSLTTSGSFLELAPGTDSAIRSTDFLEIQDFAGLHSGTDPISGNFSLLCSGKFYKNAKFEHAVRDITISANFYEMLNNIAAIGPTLKYNSLKNFASPEILFRQLKVAG